MRKQTLQFRLLLCTSYVLLSLWSSAQTSQIELSVIANKSGAPGQMTMDYLIRVLKGQRAKWSDGTTIHVALMKPKTVTGKIISQRVFNMTPDEHNKYWLAMVFQGRVRAAKFFNEESELIKYVLQTEGAIGLIPLENRENSALRVISIDGSEYLK